MSKQTLLLIGGLSIATLLLVVLAVSSGKKTPVIPGTSSVNQAQTTPYPTPKIEAALMFDPKTLTVASTSGSININLDSAGNSVTGVQIELSFDPKVIAITSITPGAFFPKPNPLFKNIDNAKGRLTYILAVSPTDIAVSGSGPVASLAFTVKDKSGGKTDIAFLQKSAITAEGVSPSVLKTTVNATILFTQQTTNPLVPAK